MSRIIGHVDGFFNGALYGWLIDLDDTATLQTITLRDAAGWEQTFSVHCYRPDVCDALGIQGVFGFALRQEWLSGFTGSLTALDSAGMAVDGGGEIAVPGPPGPPRPAGVLDVFLHLPKTAGTSLRNALRLQFCEAETLVVYAHDSFAITVQQLAAMPLHQRQRFRLVYGHVSYGLHDTLAVPARYSVFLREPLARLRSNFDHHVLAAVKLHGEQGAIGLVEACNGALLEDFDNLMVRVVAGLSQEERPPGSITSADVDRALHNIRAHFGFVGLYETMEASFAGLCDMLDVPASTLPFDNVTPPPDRAARRLAAAVDWRLVQLHNRYDRALYHAVCSAGLVGRVNE